MVMTMVAIRLFAVASVEVAVVVVSPSAVLLLLLLVVELPSSGLLLGIYCS